MTRAGPFASLRACLPPSPPIFDFFTDRITDDSVAKQHSEATGCHFRLKVVPVSSSIFVPFSGPGTGSIPGSGIVVNHGSESVRKLVQEVPGYLFRRRPAVPK